MSENPKPMIPMYFFEYVLFERNLIGNLLLKLKPLRIFQKTSSALFARIS